MKVGEIEGAFLPLEERESWECRASQLSSDNRRLCRIYQVPDGTFRVKRFVRGSGAPQWRGEWWDEVGDISITDTLDHAGHLASEYLGKLQPK